MVQLQSMVVGSMQLRIVSSTIGIAGTRRRQSRIGDTGLLSAPTIGAAIQRRNQEER
jgi:hypothetical protein